MMKFKINHTVKLISVLTCAAVCTVFLSGGEASVFFGFDKTRKIPVYCVESSEKNVSITYDAAWGSDKTLEILKELDNYKIKVTFFLVGFWVEKYPNLVREIDKRGHEIGTHSNTHPDMTKLSRTSVKAELETSIKLITDITAKPVTVFRCPFGAYNNTVIEVAAELGLIVIQWDVDSLDWKDLSTADICARIFKRVKAGSIMLFHNNSTNVVGASRLVIDKLLRDGYQFRTVSDILIKDNYKIDHTGKMKPA